MVHLQLPINSLVIIELLSNNISFSQFHINPGGIFNPLNYAPTFKAKEKEIANGRFAMFGILGIYHSAQCHRKKTI